MSFVDKVEVVVAVAVVAVDTAVVGVVVGSISIMVVVVYICSMDSDFLTSAIVLLTPRVLSS
jgi:hypothetical protein